jgi:GNAT superfamily N-acetyltransferase
MAGEIPGMDAAPPEDDLVIAVAGSVRLRRARAHVAGRPPPPRRGRRRAGAADDRLSWELCRAPHRCGRGLLVVADRRRGRSSLLDAVDAELAGRGIRDQVIAVMAGNVAAQRLYERCGFVPGEIILFRLGGRLAVPTHHVGDSLVIVARPPSAEWRRRGL